MALAGAVQASTPANKVCLDGNNLHHMTPMGEKGALIKALNEQEKAAAKREGVHDCPTFKMQPMQLKTRLQRALGRKG